MKGITVEKRSKDASVLLVAVDDVTVGQFPKKNVSVEYNYKYIFKILSFQININNNDNNN